MSLKKDIAYNTVLMVSNVAFPVVTIVIAQILRTEKHYKK